MAELLIYALSVSCSLAALIYCRRQWRELDRLRGNADEASNAEVAFAYFTMFIPLLGPITMIAIGCLHFTTIRPLLDLERTCVIRRGEE